MVGVQAVTITHPCTICYRETTLWCSRCTKAFYCCPEHLHKDWPRHRNECVPTNLEGVTQVTHPPNPREIVLLVPQNIQVTGLIFLPSKDQPELVPVSCEPSPLLQRGACPTPLVHEFFNESRPQSVVLTKGLNGDPLRFPLHLFFCPAALARGSPINRAISFITTGVAPKPWSGTVVVLRFSGTRKQGYTDATLNDLPTLSTYFLGYH